MNKREDSPMPDAPDPDVEPRRSWLPSLVWVVPLIAALIGVALVVKSITERGPVITISFNNAEGLEPGKTQVKYKDVVVGSVKAITLSKDHSHVEAAVQLSKQADDFAVKDTRFWVVRPRIGASGVSGIGTLLSGAYIGVDAGRSKDAQNAFVGLEAPPPVTGDQKGRRFTLHGESLGSIDIGSPIFYRRMQVGQVYGLSLDKDGKGVTMQVFVAAPYDQYVGTNSRWWHASGVNVRLDSNGFVVNTQSVTSILIGGLSFRAPPGQAPGPQVLERAWRPAPVAAAPTAAVLIHLRRDEMALYRGQDCLALLQAEAQRRCGMPGWDALARADFVPLRRGVRPGQLQHDPPPHRVPAPQTPAADIAPPGSGRSLG